MAEPAVAWHRSAAVDRRVEALLQQMTLEEKVDVVTGDANFSHAFYNAPVGRVGIPALTMADGPAGVRVNDQRVNEGKSTGLPAPIALGATWDPELARRYGTVIGAEAFATGHNVQLGPAVDIARVPVGGRTFESFGEDPLLQARLVVPEIRAIQAYPVVATIKHFIVNNQEYQRFTIDVRVDARALREIYLPPFEAGVRDAAVGAVMGAFNKVNGTYACENPHTLTEILREQWGFRGWVMTDYTALHSTVAAANAGLDQELPAAVFWGPRLLEAVAAGEVAVATVDEMVRRILRPMAGLGLLDRPAEVGPLPVGEHGREAREIAEQGIVLLKNAGGLLPLAEHGLGSIAVIGPEADNASVTGAGSASLRPIYGVSPLEGIRRRAGDAVRVEYAPGVDALSAGVLLPGPPAVPSAVLTPSHAAPGEHGLRAEYWTNPSFEGEPSLTRIDPQVDLNLGFFNVPIFTRASPKLPLTPPELNGRISARWTGTVTAPASGDYALSVTSLGSARLHLDGELVIGSPGPWPAAAEAHPEPPFPPPPPIVPGAGPATETVSVRLVAGEAHSITVEYAADSAEQNQNIGAQVRLGWRHPEDAVLPWIADAAALAGRCDAAIVVAADFESEMMDRPSLRLPHEQDELIRAVAAANPRTIVVLMTGAPVETRSWQDAVPALLEAWYPGQEQGNAIARVLFGDVNPSGKLPLTFPRRKEETPASSRAQYPGLEGVVHYSEGIFVGYRGYDELGIAPQFPFGHGLSYTTFEYENLHLDGAREARTSEDGEEAYMRVAFEVTNTGPRAGAEVAQVYVGRLPAPVPTPPRQLAGFARVTLEPGERRRVSAVVTRRSLSYWDTATGQWQTPEGEVPVYVGSSSRDTRLSGTIAVTASSASAQEQPSG